MTSTDDIHYNSCSFIVGRILSPELRIRIGSPFLWSPSIFSNFQIEGVLLMKLWLQLKTYTTTLALL